MTEPPSSAKGVCASCRTEYAPSAKTCPACGAPLVLVIGPEPPRVVAEAPKTSVRSVHLASLMLVIAVVAVCLAMLRELPGLGIVAILIVIPALGRTISGVLRRKRRGEPMAWDDRILLFLGSLFVVTVIGVASVTAFVATCFPAGFVLLNAGSTVGLVIAVILGLGAAAFAAVKLIQALWPERQP